MIRILTTIFLATTFFITNATVFNSNTSTGNWNNGATWDQSGAIPGLHDTVIINPGHNITVTENDSCKRLVIFDDGGSQVFFNINAGDTLWVLDSVEIYDDVDASEIFININGHMEIGGNLFINTDDDGIDLSFNINPGGSLEITRTSGRNDIRAGGPGTTVSNFDFNVNGSFICHSDLRLYNQATSSGQPINFQVNDQTTLHEDLQLRIEGSTHAEVVVDVRDSISIGQDINILVLGLATDAKCRLDLDNANAYLAVAGSVGSGGIIEASSGIESTFAYNGSSSQNIRVNTNTDYHNLAIDNAAGAILDAPLNNTNFHGDMQIKNGTLDQNNHTINIIGNWTEEGTGAITQNDSITFDGTAVQNINGTVAFTNVVLFDGSNTQNINGETSFTGKVRIENTSADGVSLAASSEVTFGELEIGNLGVLKYDTAFNITGNVVDSGAVSTAEDGDTVYFSGGSAQTIFGLINFEDAVIQNSNGVTLTSGSDSISFGDLVISSGAILNPSSTNFSVSGNWTNNAGSTGFTHSNSRVRFNGPAAQSIGGTGATFFEDLLVENTFVTAPQVTVNTGCNIYGVIDVDDGQINANNNLTLKSDSAKTAVTGRFDDGTPENPPIAGAITMERKLAEKFDSAYWRMVASPMDTTTLSQWNDDAYITGFTGSDDPGLSFLSLTTWQENACAYVGSGSINFGLSHNNGADQSGWFIYENHDTVLDLTGTLRYNFTNLVNITGLTNSGCGADPGFHLLGNPYAAHIYWDSVALSDITGGAAYVLKNDKSGNYVTYDQSTRDGNEKISSGEAFFVHTTGGAGDLTIRERHKTLSATTDSFNAVRAYIPNADPVLTIEMEANNSGFIDETRIRLKDGSSVGFDSNYEIIKLWNFDNDLNIATMLDTNELFSNSVPFDASNLRIPILLKRGYGAYNTTDSYELTFNNVEELLAYNKCIMLEDSVNGTMTPISSNGQVVNVTMMDNAPIRFFLHINSPLTMTETSPMCADDNNGASFVTGLGAGPFDYLWKNENGDTLKYSNGVSGTDSLIGLGTGIYTVEVNGNSSCNNVTSTFEIVPSVDLQTPAAVADANCYGNADGSLTINASGGSGSYMYAWSNSMTTATINNLNAGTYFVTVTDISSGCFIVDDYTISQPNEIILNKTLIHNQCFGTQNGALAVSASGNGNTYSYMWNNGSTTTQLNGLTAGDYIVTVTASSNGCQKIDTLTINSPAAIAPNVSIQNVSCHGELDGAINLNIQGGTAPYSVQWSNGMSVTNLASVGAGTFSAQIVDANGCVHSESNLTITQPAKVEADFESSLGDTVLVNQTINFTNNSSGSSTYNWNFGDGNTDIAQDPFHSYVTPGNYTVSLVAANGICTDSTANAIVVMMATSITDDFGDEAITVFHDGNMINVNFDFKSQQNVHVNIYNVIGQMMDTKTFNVMKSQESFNVPSNGVYLLEFNYGNETLTKKVRN